MKKKLKNLLLASAILAVVLVPVWSLAQGDQATQTAIFNAEGESAEGLPIVPAVNSGDAGFDKLVDWNLASNAASASDPVGLTDVALQLAYAEKTLLRSHEAFTTSTLFKLALRAATSQGNLDTLERLALGAKQYGLDDIAKEAEAAKELASATRSSVEDAEKKQLEKFEQLMTQLSDEERFQFWFSQNQVNLAFDNPDELKNVRAVLVADQELGRTTKDYLLAEVDGRIKEFESLPQEERDALLELASISRQGRGQPIARDTKNMSVPNGGEAYGWYTLYPNGQINHYIWTKQSGSADINSTLLIVVTERVNNQWRVLWAVKSGDSIGHNPIKRGKAKETTKWDSIYQETVDKIRKGQVRIHLIVTLGGPGDPFGNSIDKARRTLEQQIGPSMHPQSRHWLRERGIL